MFRRELKWCYISMTIVFFMLTIIEICVYLRMYSNILGLFYLYISFFIFFLLFTTSINFNKSNKKIRLSKVIFSIILGAFASFALLPLVPHMINYTDSSFAFNDKIYIVSRIMKPLVYLIFVIIAFVDQGINLKSFKNKIFFLRLNNNK